MGTASAVFGIVGAFASLADALKGNLGPTIFEALRASGIRINNPITYTDLGPSHNFFTGAPIDKDTWTNPVFGPVPVKPAVMPVMDQPMQLVRRAGPAWLNPGDVVGMPHLTPGFGSTSTDNSTRIGDINVHVTVNATGGMSIGDQKQMGRQTALAYQGRAARNVLPLRDRRAVSGGPAPWRLVPLMAWHHGTVPINGRDIRVQVRVDKIGAVARLQGAIDRWEVAREARAAFIQVHGLSLPADQAHTFSSLDGDARAAYLAVCAVLPPLILRRPRPA